MIFAVINGVVFYEVTVADAGIAICIEVSDEFREIITAEIRRIEVRKKAEFCYPIRFTYAFGKRKKLVKSSQSAEIGIAVYYSVFFICSSAEGVKRLKRSLNPFVI